MYVEQGRGYSYMESWTTSCLLLAGASKHFAVEEAKHTARTTEITAVGSNRSVGSPRRQTNEIGAAGKHSPFSWHHDSIAVGDAFVEVEARGVSLAVLSVCGSHHSLANQRHRISSDHPSK